MLTGDTLSKVPPDSPPPAPQCFLGLAQEMMQQAEQSVQKAADCLDSTTSSADCWSGGPMQAGEHLALVLPGPQDLLKPWALSKALRVSS